MTASPTSDQAALAFVRHHQAGLWRWLRALGCEGARAEEHCQDALLAALHHGLHEWPAVEASRWLRAAGKNLFLMQLRAERRRPQWTSFDEVEAAWSSLRGDEDGGAGALRALDQCLEVLSERDRDVVLRRYRQRQSRAAMAAALGLGEAGVKQALRRVRAKLRRCVAGRLADGSPIGNPEERR